MRKVKTIMPFVVVVITAIGAAVTPLGHNLTSAFVAEIVRENPEILSAQK